jgi:DNA sulfur modification protein DndE
MKPPVETVRISQRSRDVLVKLKRKTGIEHWNVLCRWALCASLSNPTKPVVAVSQDSNVEMSWKVFAGNLSETLPAALSVRARRDGVSHERESLAEYFKHHLERGISQIQNTKDLVDLLKQVSSYSIPA